MWGGGNCGNNCCTQVIAIAGPAGPTGPAGAGSIQAYNYTSSINIATLATGFTLSMGGVPGGVPEPNGIGAVYIRVPRAGTARNLHFAILAQPGASPAAPVFQAVLAQAATTGDPSAVLPTFVDTSLATSVTFGITGAYEFHANSNLTNQVAVSAGQYLALVIRPSNVLAGPVVNTSITASFEIA